MTEKVLVVLRIRVIPGNQMPATITQWPRNGREPVYTRISDDELGLMGSDQTAVWEAEWDGEGYTLIERVPDLEDVPF
jgi:hypothetical protein